LQESFAETLFGSITDQRSNQPVTGAVVWIEDTDFADTTDINGTYMMTGIPSGHYVVIIDAPAYRQKVFRNFLIDDLLAAGENQPAATPADFQLLGNYPNPFNPTTTVAYTLAGNGHVTLHIYDMLGRYVTRLVDEWQTAGNHQVVWDGKNSRDEAVPTGVYYYQLRAGKRMETRKMILVK
ncbi:MAG: T9SS type A sorting domain-containing protein, partial [Calditrichales bacterium]